MRKISESTVRRLSLYLRFLEQFDAQGQTTISSAALARRGGTTSAQVRKDLSFFGSFGKRGLGYPVPELVSRLREILGLGREWQVVIVGAGKIGSALAQYSGFRHRGFRVVAVYDNNPAKIGTQWDGHSVRDIAQLVSDVTSLRADIAVLAVPGAAAQDTAEVIVRAGIHGILNFAPIQLRLPEDVIVRAVNMAAELEVLSYALAHRAER